MAALTRIAFFSNKSFFRSLSLTTTNDNFVLQFGTTENPLVRKAFTLDNASKPEILEYNIRKAVEKFSRFRDDTGSPEVQIAVFTQKINALVEHSETYHKDLVAKRCLAKLSQSRKRMMEYLRRTDYLKYAYVIKELDIRPLAPDLRIKTYPLKPMKRIINEAQHARMIKRRK